MSSLVMRAAIALLLAPTGTYGQESLFELLSKPQQQALPNAQNLQQMALLEQLRTAGSAPSLSLPQLNQQSAVQQQVPLLASSAEGLQSSESDLAATFLQMPQMQSITANVPIQQVIGLMSNVEALQKKTQGLEKQLAQAQAHEKTLTDMAASASARSLSVDESARKLASLAQASVDQAKKSVEEEKTSVASMRAKLAQVESEESKLRKEKDDLSALLDETRSSLKKAQDEDLKILAEDRETKEDNAALSRAWQKDADTDTDAIRLPVHSPIELDLTGTTPIHHHELRAMPRAHTDRDELLSLPIVSKDEAAPNDFQETLIQRLRADQAADNDKLSSVLDRRKLSHLRR